MPHYIEITHPELGTAEVIESALPVWLGRGWSTADSNPQTQGVALNGPSDETSLRESDQDTSQAKEH
jgi:hypothetical protein